MVLNFQSCWHSISYGLLGRHVTSSACLCRRSTHGFHKGRSHCHGRTSLVRLNGKIIGIRPTKRQMVKKFEPKFRKMAKRCALLLQLFRKISKISCACGVNLNKDV